MYINKKHKKYTIQKTNTFPKTINKSISKGIYVKHLNKYLSSLVNIQRIAFSKLFAVLSSSEFGFVELYYKFCIITNCKIVFELIPNL